ncbi:MAG: zinc ribbon domain-containing protein [Clostridia bacterium]|nr:zinc ribbon domain-containing protein [Clostridia bacterium]
MQSVISILIAAITFVGSWGFSYGYTFDSNCFKHDYLIPRELGIMEDFVLTLNEDGSAELIRDGITLNGFWTNEDNLPEYSVKFPDQGLSYTMKIQQEDNGNFDAGMLLLEDWSEGYRTLCFTRLWQCGQCGSHNAEEDLFCPHCGTQRE